MFKCLCDTIILDDFKTALDNLSSRWLARQGVQVLGKLRLNLPSFARLL